MKETFILRTDWADSIFEMTSEGQATILRNLFRYHINSDDEMELETQEVRIVWKMIRKNIDLNIENYEKRRGINKENGSKGGRPKANETENNRMGYSGLQEEPNVTLSDTVTVTDTVFDIVTDNDIEEKKERINVATKKSPRKVSKSSEDGLLFANWFAQKYWTHHLEATDQIKNGWGVTYDILIKRGNSKNVIVKIIEWAKQDSFWSKQFLSPNKLLDKKHGADMNHFDYFAIQIKTTRDKSNNVISDQVMNNVVEAIKLNQKV